MKTSKEMLIQALTKVPFDQLDASFIVGHGKDNNNRAGTLCTVTGSQEDLMVARCMAYEQVPEFYKLIVQSLEVFGEAMIDMKKSKQQDGDKITPLAQA